MNKSIFISGKVTGLPRWWVVLKFWFWDYILCIRGYEPWNPVRQIPKDMIHANAMQICLDNLRDCEYVFFQPGYIDSYGAMKEFKLAAKLDKKHLNEGSKIKSVYSIAKYIMKTLPSSEEADKAIIDELNKIKNNNKFNTPHYDRN
jgi:hypothetical protein